eukprot:15406-Heterococcus_DN1.PRE.2
MKLQYTIASHYDEDFLVFNNMFCCTYHCAASSTMPTLLLMPAAAVQLLRTATANRHYSSELCQAA